jgi:hypothetical protein
LKQILFVGHGFLLSDLSNEQLNFSETPALDAATIRAAVAGEVKASIMAWVGQ